MFAERSLQPTNPPALKQFHHCVFLPTQDYDIFWHTKSIEHIRSSSILCSKSIKCLLLTYKEKSFIYLLNIDWFKDICMIFALKLHCVYILFTCVYLHYPKCFQQCLNPEKFTILTSVISHFITCQWHYVHIILVSALTAIKNGRVTL